MALDKEFDVGEILSASDVNNHLLGLWTPINKFVIASGSPVTNVSFPSIPSTFRIFRLTVNIAAIGDIPRVRVNNDSSSAYSYHFVLANSGSITGPREVAQTSFKLVDELANSFVSQLLIGKMQSSFAANIIGQTQYDFDYLSIGGIWNNGSSLINRIDVVMPLGNMYGIFALEGMRGS